MKDTRLFDYVEYGGCLITGFAGKHGYDDMPKISGAYTKNPLTKVYAVMRGHAVVSCHYSVEGAKKKQAELLEIQADFCGKKAVYPIKERFYELFKTKPKMEP